MVMGNIAITVGQGVGLVVFFGSLHVFPPKGALGYQTAPFPSL